MKYKIEVDVPFTDKLNETIHYQIGDVMKTPVDEKRKENIVARGLGHVVEEIIENKDETKGKGKGKGKKEEVVEPPVDPTTDDKGDDEPPVDPTTDEK